MRVFARVTSAALLCVLAGRTPPIAGAPAQNALADVKRTAFQDLDYPVAARRARIQGAVVVVATLDGGGRVAQTSAISGPPALAQAAAENARHWAFEPDAARRAVVVYEFSISGACRESSGSVFRTSHANLAVIMACAALGDAPASAAGIPGVVGTMASDEPLVIAFQDLGYPEIAGMALVQGVVVVELTLDDAGAVSVASALSGPSILATAALANARQWKFQPGSRKHAIIAYDFSIDGLCHEPHSMFRLLHPNFASITRCAQVQG